MGTTEAVAKFASRAPRVRIGIDLGGTKIEAVALDENGALLARHRVPTPRSTYEETVEELVSLIARLEAECGPSERIGVGTPGAISPSTGLIKNANSTNLIGHALDSDLAHATGRQVKIQNDANCFVLSEAMDGAGADADVVFGVIVGTGTGGGVVVHRRLLVGPNAIAGEWGHNPLPWPRDEERPGPVCYCGRQGCIESFLSGPGLKRDHALVEGLEREPIEIARQAALGESAAQACMQRYEERMARALAHVINLIDPDVIVLGGGLSQIAR